MVRRGVAHYIPPIDSSTVKEQQKVVKFEGEDEMLRRYEFHMKLLKRVNDESSNIMQSLLDSAVEGEHKVRGQVRRADVYRSGGMSVCVSPLYL